MNWKKGQQSRGKSHAQKGNHKHWLVANLVSYVASDWGTDERENRKAGLDNAEVRQRQSKAPSEQLEEATGEAIATAQEEENGTDGNDLTVHFTLHF